MCKQLCEQTEEGRTLWERWRTHHDNWKVVSGYHREMVLAAMRAESEAGARFYVHLDYRDGTSDSYFSVVPPKEKSKD